MQISTAFSPAVTNFLKAPVKFCNSGICVYRDLKVEALFNLAVSPENDVVDEVPGFFLLIICSGGICHYRKDITAEVGVGQVVRDKLTFFDFGKFGCCLRFRVICRCRRVKRVSPLSPQEADSRSAAVSSAARMAINLLVSFRLLLLVYII